MPDTNTHKKLLIIEDDADILSILDLIFKQEGYHVILSESGAEAEEIPVIKPDLVLLDLRLTSYGREGETICAKIKSQAATRHIPVILLSAEMDIREICEECGANDYLSKPFDIEQLSQKVKSLVFA